MPKLKVIFFLLVGFSVLFLISLPYYSGDVKNHVAWANSLLDKGTWGFYERDFPGFAFPNYPPLTMLLFAISLWIFNFLQLTVNFLNINLPIFPSNLVHFFEWENTKIAFLKLPAILSNVLIAVSIYNLYPYFFRDKKEKLRVLATAVFLLNPAMVYESAVWGQIDLLPVVFLLFSLQLLLKKRIVWAAILFSLVFLSKQTGIVFWPIFLAWIYKQFDLKKTLQFFLINLVTMFIFYLPFHQPSLTWLFELFQINFNFLAHSVGENTINLWGFLYDFKTSSDEVNFGIFSLKIWGYLLFFISMIYPVNILLKRKNTIGSFFVFLSILSLSDYFFLTRMHERYLIPAIVFLSLLAFYKRRYLVMLIFFSALQFINLYRGLMQPDILILNQVSSSIIFLKILVVGYLGFLIYTFISYARFKD